MIKEKEYGKSMIEMIAVIILILLILLVGLFGFKRASLTARVNTVTKDISTAVTQRRYQIAQSGTKLPHKLDEKVGSTQLIVENKPSAESDFTVLLQKQSLEMCKELKKYNVFSVKKILINGKENDSCVQENEVELYFDSSDHTSGKETELSGKCDKKIITEKCEGSPTYDADNCLETKIFNCPIGTHCYHQNLCCENDEEEPSCYTKKEDIPSAIPGCPSYIHYSGDCACSKDFTSSDCGTDYNPTEEQLLPNGVSCHKCTLKTCSEKFGSDWGESEPTCKKGQTPTSKSFSGTTCYKCEGTPTCPVCQTPEISSPTGCKKNDEENIGCAFCKDGKVHVPEDTCQTCVKKSENNYVWENKKDGDNKQENGKCCINGKLDYGTKCPKPEIIDPDDPISPDTPESCDIPLYSKQYKKTNNPQTEETKVGCCSDSKLSRTTSGNTIKFTGWKLGESTPKYGCCTDGYEKTGTTCCPTERAYNNTTCCSTKQKATETGCCDASRTYEDENGKKQCCDKVMCGTSCCSYCDVSGNACGDCEAPLYKKAYNKTTTRQTETTGCCTNDRLIYGSTNAEFNGYQFGETKLSYCCPVGYEILGDKTSTSSKCCAPEKVYTDTKGIKQCCANNQIPVGNTCCLESRKYTDIDGQEKCCNKNLVKSSDGKMVCQADEKECRPLTIKTEKIGSSKKVKMCYLNEKQTKWEGCNDPDTNDIYSIYYNGTISPIHDLELKFDILGMIDMSDSNFLENDTLDSDFNQKIYVKELGGSTLLNKSGLNDFQGCNNLGYIRYKYPKNKYDKKGDITAKGFHDETITLKAGKTYQINIDIKNICKSCVIDTSCSVY